MTLDFPSSPSDGQVYSAPNGVSYVYDFTNGYWIVQSESVAISDGSVTTSKIADGAVTPVKLDRTYVEPPIGGSVVGYQQGTWTPFPSDGTISGELTPSRWVWSRIGNTVTISAFVDKFTGTGGGVISFGGAPYPGASVVSGSASGSRVARNSLGITSCYLRGGIDEYIQFLCSTQTTANPWEQPRYSDASENSAIYFSITYITDDTTWTPINGATVS